MNNLMWSQGTKNWGDYCNPILFEMISGEKSNYIPFGDNVSPHYMMVGSILHHATSNTEVWGTGLRFDDIEHIEYPKKIYAVRGPLTREILLKNNIECPEIYGDPVLLLPKFYNLYSEKKIKLGVIPHYVDKDKIINFNNSDVLNIDIQDDFYTVINNVVSCERIISSSLHGLILADAYHIPAMWLKISNNVEGDLFKFNDYFLSVGRKKDDFIDFYSLQYITDALDYFYNYSVDIDLDKLYQVCPFRKI